MAANLPASPPAGIALFDLDGTLLPWDCQLLFRHHVLRQQPWRGIFLPVFLLALPLACGLGTGRMKRVFLSFLWRMPEAELEQHAKSFAGKILPAIYQELAAELSKHRAAGHLLILASASPEFYVAHIGRMLGFDLTLGTVVEIGRFFPALKNHKGQAKVERLREILPTGWFDEKGQLHNCHGYTDSRADLPMLGLCGAATVVNPSPALTALAEASGWMILRPARPWRNRAGFACRALALMLGLGRDPAGLTNRPGKNPASPRDTHRA